VVFRFFIAHCVASYGLVIAWTLRYGFGPCSDVFSFLIDLVFSPVGAPFLLAHVATHDYPRKHADLVLAYGTYLGVVAIDLVRSRAKPKGLHGKECRTCGYDLTGNISGVCPECGTSIRI